MVLRSSAARRSYAYVAQLESDVVPVQPGWLTQLQQRVAEAGPFWIYGTGLVNGEGYKIMHGNAVYAMHNAEFRDFTRQYQDYFHEAKQDRCHSGLCALL